MAEHFIRNERVVGSIPIVGSGKRYLLPPAIIGKIDIFLAMVNEGISVFRLHPF